MFGNIVLHLSDGLLELMCRQRLSFVLVVAFYISIPFSYIFVVFFLIVVLFASGGGSVFYCFDPLSDGRG